MQVTGAGAKRTAPYQRWRFDLGSQHHAIISFEMYSARTAWCIGMYLCQYWFVVSMYRHVPGPVLACIQSALVGVLIRTDARIGMY